LVDSWLPTEKAWMSCSNFGAVTVASWLQVRIIWQLVKRKVERKFTFVRVIASLNLRSRKLKWT